MSVIEDKNEGCFKMRVIEYHNYKTLLGPCFVSFSIPLLVPGVVLTVVGSIDNDVTFARFSGWHIAGIVILTFALVLLFIGIILKCCYKPVLSADIEKHLTPCSSRVTGNKNLGYENDSIYTGNLKSTNKVGHHDPDGGDRVVSTHDRKEVSPMNADKQRTVKQTDNTTTVLANGATKPNKTDDARHKEHKTNAQNKHPNENQRPQTLTEPSHPFSSSSVPVKVAHVKPSVSPRQEMDTAYPSSDPTENVSFLQEEKPRKKKIKKKRRQSDMSLGVNKSVADDTEASISARTPHELPELRVVPRSGFADDRTLPSDNSQVSVATSVIAPEDAHEPGVHKSALVHEGEHHDFHDLHVHFRNTPEVASPSQSVKEP